MKWVTQNAKQILTTDTQRGKISVHLNLWLATIKTESFFALPGRVLILKQFILTSDRKSLYCDRHWNFVVGVFSRLYLFSLNVALFFLRRSIRIEFKQIAKTREECWAMWLAAGAGNAWEPKEEYWSGIAVRSQANLWLVACCGNRRWWTHTGGTFTTRISFHRPTNDGCSLADLEELNVIDIFLYGPIELKLQHGFKRANCFPNFDFCMCAMLFKYWRENSNFTFSTDVKVHLFDWQPHDAMWSTSRDSDTESKLRESKLGRVASLNQI